MGMWQPGCYYCPGKANQLFTFPPPLSIQQVQFQLMHTTHCSFSIWHNSSNSIHFSPVPVGIRRLLHLGFHSSVRDHSSFLRHNAAQTGEVSWWSLQPLFSGSVSEHSTGPESDSSNLFWNNGNYLQWTWHAQEDLNLNLKVPQYGPPKKPPLMDLSFWLTQSYPLSLHKFSKHWSNITQLILLSKLITEPYLIFKKVSRIVSRTECAWACDIRRRLRTSWRRSFAFFCNPRSWLYISGVSCRSVGTRFFSEVSTSQTWHTSWVPITNKVQIIQLAHKSNDGFLGT